jgi:hypothetical protein
MGAMGHFLTFVGFLIAALVIGFLVGNAEDRRNRND